jgi:uncharacterized protein with von Willebrand factor type A (vWA) domain
MSGVFPPLGERGALVERLHSFVDELRGRGLPVSVGERIDAMRAVEGVELETPHGLHTALQATLVKSAEHLSAFDEVFRLYFQLDLPAPARRIDAAEDGQAPGPLTSTPLDLEHALRTVLRDGSEVLARMIAEQAVARFARFEAGHPVAGILYESRTVNGLRLDQVRAELAGAGQAGGDGAGSAPAAGTGGPSGQSGTGRQLGFAQARDAIAEHAELVRQQIREVIRELLVADRGLAAVAKTLRTPLPTDVVIASASPAQMAEIERVLAPLQRKLATSMMRKRRSRHGPLDVRATLRASMATGGIPVRVVHRRPVPTKPKLYVLADMSGSVATFAAFTITLVSGMAALFSQLRTFAFVENTVEVTELFRENNDPVQAVKAMNNLRGLNFLDASTDYGRALRQFHREVGPHLGRRSTVLIFGDARGNFRPAQESTLAQIAKNAGALYWLNPEREQYWGSGDSLMNVYAPHCTEAVSCRTLSDLRRFVENLG